MYIKNEHEILLVEEVDTGKQKATVKRAAALYYNLSASYAGGEVSIELREPVIGEWSGALINESLTAEVYVDDELAGEVDIVDGLGSFEFDASQGTYVIRIDAPLCASAELGVAI